MKRSSMKSPARRDRTYTKQQNTLRQEFCGAYGFKPQQIAFDGDSLDPIFDFDALSVLSVKLCDLPAVDVDFGEVIALIQMATSRAYAVLKNGNTRKIYGVAFVGEPMPDGEEIASIQQAVKVSRARALRAILRAVGFDPVAAHRAFKKDGNVIDLHLPTKMPRDKERAEIHLLAQGLGLITNTDRLRYENLLFTLFGAKKSSTELSDSEHTQWLQILRAWKRARAVASDKAA